MPGLLPSIFVGRRPKVSPQCLESVTNCDAVTKSSPLFPTCGKHVKSDCHKVQGLYILSSASKMVPLGDSSAYSDSVSFEFDSKACTARDEAAKLKNDVCQLQVRLEEVEDERKYAAAKANELEEVLRAFKQDHVHEELVKKSLQLAEISMTLDSLKSQIQNLKDEKAQLVLARTRDNQKMEALSAVFRSLQCNSKDVSEDGDEEGEVVLTPEKALDMALKNMKYHIEFLEDEHQNISHKCTTQEKKITQLERENEMKELKINMLEELFRALNDQRKLDEEVKMVATPSPAPEQSIAPRPRVFRGNRPAMKKASSWAGLVESEKRLEESTSRTRPDGMANRRSVSSRGLNDETKSIRSSSRRKITMLAVGDLVGEYVGPLVAGKPHGVGTVRFSNGDTYLGEVNGGKLSGKGTMYTKSGVNRGLFEENIFIH